MEGKTSPWKRLAVKKNRALETRLLRPARKRFAVKKKKKKKKKKQKN